MDLICVSIGESSLKTFSLNLQSSVQQETVADIVSFVGEDASGVFGIMAGHERMMTVLEFGLARFRTADHRWHFLALPGGVLYFVENTLFICTHRFIRSDDYETVAAAISGILAREEEGLKALRSRIERMEQEMIRHLWGIQRERG